jgi:hypothetical protein
MDQELGVLFIQGGMEADHPRNVAEIDHQGIGFAVLDKQQNISGEKGFGNQPNPFFGLADRPALQGADFFQSRRLGFLDG